MTLHGIPRPRRPSVAARPLALARSHGDTVIMTMPFTAFPGHAGRWWPLARWRSLARTEIPLMTMPFYVAPSR